jgi:internalin A
MVLMMAPKFTILPEHKLSVGEEAQEEADLFALASRLGPMFDVLRHKETRMPVSMAICGGEGVGKTMALNWLDRQLDIWNALPAPIREGHPQVMSIRFSARRVTRADSAARMVMSELLLGALKKLDPKLMAKRSARIKAAALQCGDMLGRGFIDGLKGVARRWGILDSLSSILSSVSAGDPSSETRYEGCLDLLAEWIQEFEEKESPVRLVVFVDGLDYVQPDVIVALFNVLGLELKNQKLAFVCTLNHQIAQMLLKQHFATHEYGALNARYYLNKIFQLECDVEPNQQQIKGFYEHQLALLDLRNGGQLSRYIKPEFQAIIEVAILQLAKSNPRKIKRLLNGALMGAYAAVGTSDSPEEVSLVFMQRMQLFLLQRWLSFFSAGAASMYRSEVLDWFDALSCAARSGTIEFAQLSRQNAENSALLKVPQGLSMNLIQEWVWDLLKIPFAKEFPDIFPGGSRAVASSDSMLSLVSAEELLLASRAVKDALAASLVMSVGSLSAADVSRISELDLSDMTLSDADLQFVGKLEHLELLDLHNSSVRSVGALVGLRHLRQLNLSCTPVEDLTPLSALLSLEKLDLSMSKAPKLPSLRGLDKLVSLCLYGASFTDVTPVCECAQLMTLNLSGTQIGDDQMSVIEKIGTLKSLYLRGTNVTAERVVKLNSHFHFSIKIDY